jgi:hypothetical protein
MGRSPIHLPRLLFGISCVVAFGFGATQAVADVGQAQARACSCQRTGYVYHLAEDCPECPSGAAYCDGRSTTPICWP